jgi:beta-lactamase regulating signal transducer with metallopeptidase domain
MTEFALSSAVMRPLSWVLLHFIWQGLALAAALYALLSICRRPTTRYALGVATLILMMAAPAITFLLVTPANSGAVRSRIQPLAQVEMQEAATPMAAPGAPRPGQEPASTQAYAWLVEAWFAGVIFFSLRAAGGLFWLQRLRRRDAQPVGSSVESIGLALQRKLGLDRAIRYCQSNHLEAPAVIGWFRPVVMLPLATLTGLDSQQLEAVIAHELAHIRRFDCFVNLFQVAAEAVLFYHPAMWWVNRQIRVERENCCDDIAVSVSGGATEYARALMALEERRGSVTMALAVNGSPLARRIARLLGLPGAGRELQSVTFAAGFLALAGALLAGTALLGVTHGASPLKLAPSLKLAAQPTNVHSVATSSAQLPTESETGANDSDAAQAGESAAPVRAATVRSQTSLQTRTQAQYLTQAMVRNNVRAIINEHLNGSPAAMLAYAQQGEPVESGKESYIDGMKAAGFDNLTADQLIALKVQGVTPAYVREMRAAGFKPSIDELIGLKVQGVSPEYIREMKDAGFKPNLDEIIGLKVQGVTASYIRDMRAAGVNVSSLDSVIGMKVQGVTPEYIRDLNAEGLHPNTEEIVGMKVQGVTPEYVRGLKASGITASVDEIVGMKVQGITPQYISDMKALGINGNADELVGMKIQGVTPEYVRDIRATGLNPSADQFVGMKVQGVTADYIHGLQSAGLKNLKVDDCVSAKVMGVTPEFIEKARSHGFKDLSLEKLIELKNADVF